MDEVDRWLKETEITVGKKIGKLERIFYIYAFMFNSLGLLSGWIVLKAFFSWIPSTKPDESTKESLRKFYLYIWGNALSILLALVLSKVGNILSETILVSIKLYKDLI